MGLGRRLVVVAVAVVALVTAYLVSDAPTAGRSTGGPGSAGPHVEHAAGDPAVHDHHCGGRGRQVDGTWVCDVTNAQLRSARPFDAVATRADRSAALRFAARTEVAARRYEDVDAARSAGYTFEDRAAWVQDTTGTPLEAGARAELRSGAITHVVNERLVNDGKAADPDHPEALLYATDGDRYVLVGAMFLAPLDVEGPQVGGPLTTWHTHTEGDVVCWDGAAPVGFARFRPGDQRYVPTGGCARGRARARSPQMLHVWFGRNSLSDTFDSEMTADEAAAVLR